MTVRLVDHVSTTETEDGLVLLDARSGRYWQLNRTGAEALRMLLDGADTGEIAARLSSRHPEAAERIGADVTSLVESLRAARLVVVP